MDRQLVESHTAPGQAILILGLGVGFFGLLSAFLIFIVAPQYEIEKQILLTLLGIGLLGFSYYSLQYYFRDVPKIFITTSKIIIKSPFKKREVMFHDLDKIELGQKSFMTFLFISWPMESTIIHTKTKEQIVIWDHYYENIGNIKRTLDRIMTKIQSGDFDLTNYANTYKPKLTTKDIHTNELLIEKFETYSGSRFLNFNGLIFWGMLSFSIIKFNYDNIFGFLFVNSIFYGLIGYQSNYFLVSDNYLQVKNHLWFWKKATFRLSDIKEIVIEMPHRLSYTARIILDNYSTSLHSAGSLKDGDWIKLMDKLESKGIKVRDDLYLRD